MLDELDLLTLNAPAGAGQINDPADVAALDNGLRRIDAYTPPPEYGGEPQAYATEPMIRALEKFQEHNGLRIDGYAKPNGPTERAINNCLLEKPKGAGLMFDPPASLAATVGNGFENRHGDVATVQRMLGALGELPEDPFDSPRGFVDENTTGAIRSFQRKRGLVDDGWLGPNGETERALHLAISDLARAKGREWLKFAERAGRTQARMTERLSDRTGPRADEENKAGEVVPVAWPGARGLVPESDSTRQPEWPRQIDDEGRVEPAQTAPGDWIVPFLFLTVPGLLGIGEANRQRAERQRLDGDDNSGSKTELIPPHVPNEPFRGPDPAKPPLDTKLTRPSPHPSESPHKPEQERLTPPRIDPRDLIEILPDQSDWIAHLPIIVENRQGGSPTKNLNRKLGIPTLEHGRAIFGKAGFQQIGGPIRDADTEYKEEFDEFRDKEKFGFKSNSGASYEDVTFRIKYGGVDMKVIVNTVTVEDGKPIPREERQRAKLVMNVKDHALIIEVPKPRPGESVDIRAWDRYVEGRLRLVKDLIDKKTITADGFNQKLLDFFGRHPRK